jgi:hypothetical protein
MLYDSHNINHLLNRHGPRFDKRQFSPANASIPNDRVLGPLYTCYTLPTSSEPTTSTFERRYCSTSHGQWYNHCATDNANQPRRNSKMFKEMGNKTNGSKWVHVTFTTRRETCRPIHINNVQLPQEHVKYLELHVDRRLTRHIFVKRKHLGMTLTKMYCLLGRKAELSTSNKILIYKAIIWTYSIQLWGVVSTSNIEILERCHSKALRMTVAAPWCVPGSYLNGSPSTRS